MNKLTAILLMTLVLLSSGLLAQNRSGVPAKPNFDPFLRSQWYLGFRGGMNLTNPGVMNSYSALEPLNYDLAEIAKSYDGMNHPGGQAALIVTFYTRGFSISFEPGFMSNIFEHNTSVTWQDSQNPTNSLRVDYNHRTRLDYLEFPLSVKYDLLRGNIRPFIGVGASYGLLMNASRKITRTGEDVASGFAGPFNDAPLTVGIKDQFIRSAISGKGFAGVSYDPGNIRLILDFGYQFGFNNISNTKTRYSENLLSGTGEATDDLKLGLFTTNLSVVFPLKFISKSFSSFN